MQKITTCLWFDNNAEEAVNFYLSIFEDARIIDVSRYTDVGPGPKGSVLTITFTMAGQEFMALNGGPHFKFTPAISLIVNCSTQEEIDSYWENLQAGGGREDQCGWLTDRFGLSWQVVPAVIAKMMTDKDEARVNRVMAAILKMKKIDIATLQRAYDGQ